MKEPKLWKMADKWKKIKNSGNFKRKIQKKYLKILVTAVDTSVDATNIEDIVSETPHVTGNTGQCDPSNERLVNWTPCQGPQITEPGKSTQSLPQHDEFPRFPDEKIKNDLLYTDLQKWAVSFNIKQNALKDLLLILNNRFPNVLPKDPRTFLKTDQTIHIQPMGDGQYWHNGFVESLTQVFPLIHQFSHISIKINIDGLPIYKSSKDEFWPILANIEEAPEVQPMVIGVYCGKSKPKDVNQFLTPFVDEMRQVLADGVIINGHKMTVSIRCFICDSPARAFVKGKI